MHPELQTQNFKARTSNLRLKRLQSQKVERRSEPEIQQSGTDLRAPAATDRPNAADWSAYVLVLSGGSGEILRNPLEAVNEKQRWFWRFLRHHASRRLGGRSKISSE
jgi:hypothetical protein